MANARNLGLASNQLKSNYRKEVEVYVEGADDLGIYKNYWFPNLAGKVAFKRAEDGDIPVPGCAGVEKNVMVKRLAGANAYGLIDRDSIEDMHLTCETDDISFVTRNHNRNPHIYVTIRWEIENYLIDSAAWEQARVDAKTRGEGKRTVAEVEKELLEHCDVLIAHAAANAVRSNARLGKIGDGYEAEAKTRADFEARLFNGPMKALTVEEKQEYNNWIKKIEAFDIPDAPARQRILAVCRRLHGKALLERFRRKHKIDNDIRFGIARSLSEAAKVPSEIVDKLNSWIGH